MEVLGVFGVVVSGQESRDKEGAKYRQVHIYCSPSLAVSLYLSFAKTLLAEHSSTQCIRWNISRFFMVFLVLLLVIVSSP